MHCCSSPAGVHTYIFSILILCQPVALRSRDEQESRIREIGDDDEDVAMDVEESDGSEQGLTSPGAMSP